MSSRSGVSALEIGVTAIVAIFHLAVITTITSLVWSPDAARLALDWREMTSLLPGVLIGYLTAWPLQMTLCARLAERRVDGWLSLVGVTAVSVSTGCAAATVGYAAWSLFSAGALSAGFAGSVATIFLSGYISGALIVIVGTLITLD